MAFNLGKFFSNNSINEPFLELRSPVWKKLEGGYRVMYDASIPLKKLEQATDIKEVNEIYLELWNELHHQGDVDLASYYAVPHLVRIALQTKLVDYNVLSMVSLIEIRRHKDNPQIPNALLPAYNNAIQQLPEIVKIVMNRQWDLDLASPALAAIALAKGQLKLAEAIFNLDDEDRIAEVLEMY